MARALTAGWPVVGGGGDDGSETLGRQGGRSVPSMKKETGGDIRGRGGRPRRTRKTREDQVDRSGPRVNERDGGWSEGQGGSGKTREGREEQGRRGRTKGIEFGQRRIREKGGWGTRRTRRVKEDEGGPDVSKGRRWRTADEE